jgi:hypothetical protein
MKNVLAVMQQTIGDAVIKFLKDKGKYTDKDQDDVPKMLDDVIKNQSLFFVSWNSTVKTIHDQAIAKGVAAALDRINGKALEKGYLEGKGLTDKLPQTLDDLVNQIQMKIHASGAPPAPKTGAGVGALVTVAKSAAVNPAAQSLPGPSGDGTPDAGPFQVVFLPDFEEQYAIRNINVTAKTKYHYTFRNGTDLETVSGTYNAAEVPVKIVETVGALITAVGEVAKTRLQSLPAGGARLAVEVGPQVPDADFYLRREQSIEPGVYRVQKSWERAAAVPLEGLPCDQLCGLLSDVGLPVVDSVAVIDAATHKAETEPAAKQAPPAP